MRPSEETNGGYDQRPERPEPTMSHSQVITEKTFGPCLCDSFSLAMLRMARGVEMVTNLVVEHAAQEQFTHEGDAERPTGRGQKDLVDEHFDACHLALPSSMVEAGGSGQRQLPAAPPGPALASRTQRGPIR